MTAARIQSLGGQLLYPELPIFHVDAVGTAGTNLALTSSFAELTVFTNERVNRGNHFNTSTGRFTAPVAGVYEFENYMISGNANDVFRFQIYVNGASAGKELRLDTGDTTNADYLNGSMKIYQTLAKGDYVSVYGRADGGSNAFIDAGSYSFFNGRLIG